MGSTMKRSIFDEQTSKALKNWRKHAMHKKPSKKHATVETRTLGSGGSPMESPMHTELDDVNIESAETELQEHGTATIVTSVDRNDNYDNRDLLTGP
jgi:mlo protein